MQRVPWTAAGGLGLVVAVLLSPFSAPCRAEEPKHTVIGKSLGADGSILERAAVGKPWEVVKKDGELLAEESILGLPGATLTSTSGAVRLALLADLDRTSPLPVYEAVVTLHEDPKVDLDFTLERGRVSFSNTKDKGSATVRFHFRDQVWEAKLLEPGAKIALEFYSLWAPGAKFKKKPGPNDVPVANLNLVVVQGSVQLKHHDGDEHHMTAPKGPAFIDWSNTGGGSPTPLKLDELPPWTAEDPTTAAGKEKMAGIEKLRKLIVAKGVDDALEEMYKSDNKLYQRGAIVLWGATDHMDRLAAVLQGSGDPEIWNQAVITIRHWIGRAPGQDQILYGMLIDKTKMSPAHAGTIMQLLHSFDEAALKKPETYDMLISYLDHERLGVRGLAYWHLRRLVPAGKDIKYNPLDSAEARAPAIEQWRKLIPAGEVPKAPAL